MYRYKCASCGCEDIAYDATARWDVAKQEFYVTDVQDTAYCEACDAEVKTVEVKEG